MSFSTSLSMCTNFSLICAANGVSVEDKVAEEIDSDNEIGITVHKDGKSNSSDEVEIIDAIPKDRSRRLE